MHITSTLKNRSGQTLKVEYKEDDPLRNLSGKILQAVRAFCFYGDKMVVVYSDPDGEVTEIKLIDPKDYKQYFDWGEIGEKIVERALEMLSKQN